MSAGPSYPSEWAMRKAQIFAATELFLKTSAACSKRVRSCSGRPVPKTSNRTSTVLDGKRMLAQAVPLSGRSSDKAIAAPKVRVNMVIDAKWVSANVADSPTSSVSDSGKR